MKVILFILYNTDSYTRIKKTITNILNMYCVNISPLTTWELWTVSYLEVYNLRFRRSKTRVFSLPYIKMYSVSLATRLDGGRKSKFQRGYNTYIYFMVFSIYGRTSLSFLRSFTRTTFFRMYLIRI